MSGKQYSYTELEKHSSENDCWVAIDGKVYDITKWLPHHPGGKEILMLSAGRDVTNLFESYHPMTDKPGTLLKNYEIGYLSQYELPRYVKKSAFYGTLRDKVRAHFKATDQDPQMAVGIFARLALVYILIGLGYYFAHFVTRNLFLNMVLAVFYGMAESLFAIHMMHDTCHAAITHSPKVWKWLGATFDFLTGASMYAWNHQHVIGHHLYTNIRNADPDLGQGEIDFRIVTPYQTRSWYHKYQHLYAPVLYGLYTLKYRLQDNESFVKRTNGQIRVTNPSTFEWASYILGKVSFLFFRFFIPLVVLKWNIIDFTICFLITELYFGYYLTINFQVSHIAEELQFYGTPIRPDEPALINEDWAILQVKTTQDYGHGSLLCNFFSGGLNHQVVHHLFPSIDQEFYPQLVPILKDVCKQYGITYHHKPTFKDAFMSHINYLYKMGNDPDYVRKDFNTKQD